MSNRRSKIAVVILILLFMLALHLGYRWIGYRPSPRRTERRAATGVRAVSWSRDAASLPRAEVSGQAEL